MPCPLPTRTRARLHARTRAWVHARTRAWVPSRTRARTPRRWWTLAALVASTLVIGFDTTILNIALPTMASALHADIGEQQWIVDSYTVVFAAAMLPAGLLGDRFGRRRMLITGLLIFLTGALIGALVSTPAPVVVARLVMGLGAALVMPLSMAVLPTFFGPGERSRAIAALSAAMGLRMPLGPLVGGWLLDHFWWGSIFLINLPLVAIAILACLFLLPETRDPAAPRIDLTSTALSVGGLIALVTGPHRGPVPGLDPSADPHRLRRVRRPAHRAHPARAAVGAADARPGAAVPALVPVERRRHHAGGLLAAAAAVGRTPAVAILLPRTVPADQGAMAQETADARQ
ncbi:hypothetical protein GCM10009579_42690 [Streptomyces javensis]|uniref:Major facilitator superfamily (MFS) profile domain-containing protein n=1 Tax=Streptomyces javensis TaxID=114698 RepID=A0ABN1X1L4_9ACTN